MQGRFGDESPETVLLRNESVAGLLQALSALPTRQRIIVRGFYFEGRSIDAMARDRDLQVVGESPAHERASNASRVP
jgi:DNA-directed RNA polymerase specialized sigma24 family protein